MVFLFHVSYLWTAGPFPTGMLFTSQTMQVKYADVFGLAGETAVCLFFMLSGFILAWSARPHDTPMALWRRRFFKVYPSHAVNFTVILILFVAVSGLTLDRGQVILNLFLLQAWVPGFNTIFSVNPMAWSMSCELLFYLTLPFWLYVIARIKPERLWAWAIAIVVAVFLMPTLGNALIGHRMMMPGMAEQQWFLSIFPPVRLLEFIFGILLARILSTGRRIPLSFGGAVAFAVAAYAIEGIIPVDYTYTAVMALPIGLLLLTAAKADTSGHGTLLSRKAFVWLGNLSFAFYLWHYPVLAYVHRWLGLNNGLSIPDGFGMIVVNFVITLALAMLSFYLIERPIYRRFADPRTKTPVMEPVAVPASSGKPE